MGLLGKAARLVSGRKKEDKAGQGSSPAPSSPSYDSPGTTGDVPLSAADALTLVKGAVTKDNRKGEAEVLVERCRPGQPLPQVEEVFNALRRYIETKPPDVSSRTLLLLDRCQYTADRSLLLLISSPPFMHVLLSIASTGRDTGLRSLVMQLLVDWASATHSPNDEFVPAYAQAKQELEMKGIAMPPPSGPGRAVGMMPTSVQSMTAMWNGPPIPSPPPGTGMVTGRPIPVLSPPPQPVASRGGGNTRSSMMQQTHDIDNTTISFLSDQIQSMLNDIKLLEAAISAGGQSAATPGDEIWAAADRCKSWQPQVQDMLMQDLPENLLAAVLEGNDTLNIILFKWEMSKSVQGNDTALVDLSFTPSSEGPDPFSSWAPPAAVDTGGGSGGNAFSLVGSGVSMPTAAAGGASTAEVTAMRTELSQVKAALAVSEGRVNDATERLRALSEANAALEEKLAGVQAEAQAAARELMAAQRATEAVKGQLGEVAAAENEQLVAMQAAADAAQAAVATVQAEKAELEKTLRAATKEKRELEVKLMEAESRTTAAKRLMEEMQAQVQASAAAVAKATELEKRCTSQALELKKEAVLRKKAMNELRALKGNIRVCARVRPTRVAGTTGDDATADDVALQRTDEFTIALQTVGRGRKDDAVLRKYEFDTVFAPDASQKTVYDEALELLQMSMDGYNVCLFAYGQTGTGKTHTILGAPGDEGLLPRLIGDVFDFANVSGGLANEVKVACYMLELYQDTLVDMLDVNAVGKKLEIKRDNSGVVRVEGASVKDAANAAELRALLDTGLANRRTAETKMNTQSSRSHLIFSILVQNHVPATNTTTSGKITFVDLAGSERVARSGALNDNERLKEAAAINKSLSALGDVVSALTEGAAFVPYRNHKLTQLMADSLGGNAKCCMIVNVSPLAVDADETKSSLDYATRVKLVTNEASKSMETREIAKLKAEIAKLKGR